MFPLLGSVGEWRIEEVEGEAVSVWEMRLRDVGAWVEGCVSRCMAEMGRGCGGKSVRTRSEDPHKLRIQPQLAGMLNLSLS